MSCKGTFDLESIEALASTTEAGVFALSGKSWLVLQAAMSVVANYWQWCGMWGNGEALTDAERQAIDEIVSEVQQAINEMITSGNFTTLAYTEGLTGTSTTNVVADLYSEDEDADLLLTAYSDAVADQPNIDIRKARGTRLAPTGIKINDILGRVVARGYDTASFAVGALIRVLATQDWTSTARGAKIEMQTVQDGTTTPTTRVTVHNDGRVQVGGTFDHDGSLIGFNGSTPVAKGTITGSRSSGAALASLLTYLASRGDITDSSTP